MRRTEYTEAQAGNVHVDPAQALELDEALRRLEIEDKRAAKIVELHYFAGLPIERIAELLELSARTVHRDWSYARAFLAVQLES